MSGQVLNENGYGKTYQLSAGQVDYYRDFEVSQKVMRVGFEDVKIVQFSFESSGTSSISSVTLTFEEMGLLIQSYQARQQEIEAHNVAERERYAQSRRSEDDWPF